MASLDDFGTLGTPPSHPELLDWLATEFVDRGWEVKQVHREVLLSAAYQRDSLVHPVQHAQALSVDPDNRLLWRQTMRRIEAEAVRDATLAISGQLASEFFGPAVPVARRGDGEVTVADGANDRRRSIYVQAMRSNPVTMLQVFDQPVMETNCNRRSRSTVSTQALTLLNSDFMNRAAQRFAESILAAAPEFPEVVAAERAWSRPVPAEEQALLQSFTQQQMTRYRTESLAEEESRRRALVDLCQMLLSSNEFVYID